MHRNPNPRMPVIEVRLLHYMHLLTLDPKHANKRVVAAHIDYTDPSMSLTIDFRYLRDDTTTYRICTCQTHPGFSVSVLNSQGDFDDSEDGQEFESDADLSHI
jgi:hypothetical protein